MKIRSGFVSNSSSASFIISLSDLTSEQLYKIQNYKKWLGTEDFPDCEYADNWRITVDSELVKGYSSMDNFGMYDFLLLVAQVPRYKISFDRDG